MSCDITDWCQWDKKTEIHSAEGWEGAWMLGAFSSAKCDMILIWGFFIYFRYVTQKEIRGPTYHVHRLIHETDGSDTESNVLTPGRTISNVRRKLMPRYRPTGNIVHCTSSHWFWCLQSKRHDSKIIFWRGGSSFGQVVKKKCNTVSLT